MDDSGRGCSDLQKSALEVARRHGLDISSVIEINELGLDFRVTTALDRAGQIWLLRQPRRPDVFDKIQHEARILQFLKPRLPFAVPDWRLATNELIAYPRLNDSTALQIEPSTGELEWNIDLSSDLYTASLGEALAALHRISISECASAGFRKHSPAESRARLAHEIDRVARAFEVHPELMRRWNTWLEDETLWPDFTTVVHGDLYAGHILVNQKNEITAMIDWTEAEIGDPSVDFCSHLLLFGEVGLQKLIHSYSAAGGRTWPAMANQIRERLAATPLKYALLALRTSDDAHLESARSQLLQPSTPQNEVT